MKPRLPVLRFALLLLGWTALAATAAPRADLRGDAEAWQLAEFVLQDVPAVTNPFDPEHITIDATVVAPSGSVITLPAFWHQVFRREGVDGAEQLTPDGEPHWRLRHRPTEAGEHRLRLTVKLGDGTHVETPELRFAVAPPTQPTDVGWVRVADNRRHFATHDGRPLLLAGHNVCWPTAQGTFDYDAWFRDLARTGQNFARLWLAPWWAPIEHLPGTLNQYRLDAAWQLDQVFAAAEEHGIYLMLCLDHHGMYQPVDPTWGGGNAFWRRNPYSAEQGGPCAVAADFFRLPAAKALYQKRLRYLIGRYSHSPRLMAWQFFNEIDNIFDRAPVDEATVVDWHREMAQWLRAQDPYQHVIGTSLTGGVDRPAFWNLPEMEFTSYHAYWEPAPARRVAALMSDFTARYQKPALTGEFGVNGAHWDAAADPHLRGFRQHLWGATLGGSATTALSWWWEDVHVDGALRLEQTLVDLLRDLGWFDGGWEPAAIVDLGRPPTDLAAPTPNAAPFSVAVALNPFRRLRLDGEFALADRLAAERAAEHLSAVLWGRAEPSAQRPLRLRLWTTAEGRAVVRVQETTGPATLVAKVNGSVVWQESFAEAGAVNRDYEIRLGAGLHQLELLNDGVERIVLASLRVEDARPAAFSGGWTYPVEAVALRRDKQAVLYLVSPRAVYPAGAIRYDLPPHENGHVTLARWIDGPYRVRWLSPESGTELEQTQVTAEHGQLKIDVPSFSTDLAAVIEPAPAESRSQN